MQSSTCLQLMIVLILCALIYHNSLYLSAYVGSTTGLSTNINTSPLQQARPRNVFILGDSLSRFVVIGACGYQWKNRTRDWAGGLFPYKRGSSGSMVCPDSEAGYGGKIAHLQLYGSADTGPYLHGHKNDKQDPFTDTPVRMCKGLEVYVKKEGEPTHVVYGVMNWDLHLHENKTRNGTDAYAKVLVDWEATLNRRLDDVLRCKPDRSTLVVHTAPHTKWGSDLMVDLNQVIRRVCTSRRVFWIDWDREIWKGLSPEDQRKIFRDIMHPNPEESERFASRLLSFDSDAAADDRFRLRIH